MAKVLNLQRELVHIAAALNIYGFASALIGVFIPLVILKSGGQLWQIAVFYLIYALVKLVLNYPITLLIQRKGAHFGIAAGFIGGTLEMLAILGFASNQNVGLLVAGAMALSLTNAFVWNSQHLFISQAMQNETKSSNLATISILGQFTDIVAPALGGFIGTFFGSKYLLLLALVLCLVALIPLRGMRDIISNSTTLAKIEYNFSGAPPKDLLANFFYNIETSIGVMVWPIYLAVYIKTFKSIGLITSIAAIATILSIWLAGHRGDKGKDRQVLKQGAAISSIVHIARIFVFSAVPVTIVSSAYRASLAYLQNAWTSTYYYHAKKKGLQYIMSMEIACDLAYVTLWGMLLIILLAVDSRAFFVASFIIAAVAAWGCLLITRQSKSREAQ